MGCTTCSSGGCGTADKKTSSGVSGCKNNGVCGTGGCNKMSVFDWLGNMDLPTHDRFDVVEVRFKNGGKDFFRNIEGLDLITGDPVMVEMQNGYHMGTIALQGELVRLQMLKRKTEDNEEIKSVLRIATQKDLERFEKTQERNLPTLYRTREIIRKLELVMKLSDVEFQADNSKATFFYSADERVDFRELIKVLAAEFKIRVEMKQISLRQEAGRLGGIGSCGRELCCSTWLTDFKSVSTAAARYQNLSLNPNKLSGQCGRLKCCLNYELETYMDALEGIPTLDKPLQTKKGPVYLQKTDIFKKMMWFGYSEETVWHSVSVERVVHILEMNEKGIVPETLEKDKVQVETKSLNVPLLPMSENKKKNKKKTRNRRNRKNKQQQQKKEK